MKIIKSRFQSWCKAKQGGCGGQIEEGEEIGCVNGNWFHVSCAQSVVDSEPDESDTEPLSPEERFEDFEPSKYQRELLQQFENNKAHIVCEAVAGSGKTTTIEWMLHTISPSAAGKAVFLAFNRAIADELKSRLPKHVPCYTIHSAGFKTCKNSQSETKLDNNLVKSICEKYWPVKEVDDYSVRQMNFKIRQYLRAILSLSRATLNDDYAYLIDRYGIEIESDALPLLDAVFEGIGVVQKDCIRAYKEAGVIDFDGMIWLPNVLDLPPHEVFDTVFVDETQDLNKAQVELVLKLAGTNGRIVAVGDRSQSIYGFRGADTESIPNLISRLRGSALGCVTTPLSICYRCPESVIDLVNRLDLVPNIEARPEAPVGTIDLLRLDIWLDSLTADSEALVLSRTNAPMMAPVLGLIRRGIKSRVQGRDVGRSLRNFAKRINGKVNQSVPVFVDRLKSYCDREYHKLIAAGKVAQLQALEDKVDTLIALTDGVQSVDDALERIDLIFKDDGTEGVVFSTIHRCVSPNTIVESESGLVRAKNLVNDKFVGTVNGPMPYSNFVKNPPGPLLEIQTRSGYCLTVTPDHRLMAWDGTNYTPQKARALKAGDYLRLKMGCGIDPDCLPDLPSAPSGLDCRAHIYSIPTILTDRLAEFLGLIVADGTIYRRGFRLAKRHRDLVYYFRDLCLELFGVEANTFESKCSNVGYAEVNSVQLVKWLSKFHGLLPHQKAIPRVVLASPIHYQKSFLRGLFADGTVNVKDGRLDHIRLTQANHEIIELVHVMLLRCGIVSSRVCIPRRKRNHWAVNIYGQNAKRFAHRIGFIESAKQEAAIRNIAGREINYSVPVSKDRAKSVLKGNDRSNAKMRGRLSRASLQKYEDFCDDLKFHHERIRSIHYTSGPSVCVEVPDHGRFLQNGFDGCNSKGLEADHVVILNPELIPGPWAKQTWQLQEERNIQYVAYTRTKDRLTFIGNAVAGTRPLPLEK